VDKELSAKECLNDYRLDVEVDYAIPRTITTEGINLMDEDCRDRDVATDSPMIQLPQQR
jgi:hypothetical protein